MNQAVEALNKGLHKHLKEPEKYLYGLSILSNSGMVSAQELDAHIEYFDQNAKNKGSVLRLMKMGKELQDQQRQSGPKIMDLISKNDVMRKWKNDISRKAGFSLSSQAAEFNDLAEIVYVAVNILWMFTKEEMDSYSAVNKIMKRMNQPDLKNAVDFIMDELLIPRIHTSYPYDQAVYDNARTNAAKRIGVFLTEEYYLGSMKFDLERFADFEKTPVEIEKKVNVYFNQWNRLFAPSTVVKNKELFGKLKAVFNG
ncbi:MAG: hypothetical protein HUJ55_01070 [Ileibacterium sp.]|nr:hypothetical protein [Ileibacterium sp.]